uniref:Uncharacterized protein n=1 Tax=Romanomermis culicivorax TaxID=13658 RepID=A0A915K8W4_ROMCU
MFSGGEDEKPSISALKSQAAPQQQTIKVVAPQQPPTEVSSSSSPGGISDKLIDQCAEEMGAVKIENSKVKEPIYAYTEVGTWPEARRILVKLFTNDSKKTSVYFKTFKTACLEARLEPLPADEDLRNILNDYTTLKNRVFSLIGV